MLTRVKTKVFAISIIGTVLIPTSIAAAYQVYGAIGEKWQALGAERGILGTPTSEEVDTPNGGRFQSFGRGYVIWNSSIGAHTMFGSIYEKWKSLGGVSAYGFPITDESPGARGGRFNDFDRGNSIYWSSPTGAHAVYGFIRNKWRELGGDNSFLKYPTTDELPAANGGRMSEFEGGVIYWHPSFGAHTVYGRILEGWNSRGRESGVCGYPTSDEYDFDDGRDTGEYGIGKRFRRSDFTNGKYILFSKSRNQLIFYCDASTPPPSTPRISVEFVRFSGQNLGEFRISGSGFRGNPVTIKITSRSNSGAPSTSNTPTNDDGNGNISLPLSVFCGAGTTLEFTAIDASGNTSSTVGRSCP
jgi:LGFP repeat